jgi:hypothetical protein
MTKTPAQNATLLVCSECGVGNYRRDAHSHSVNCTNPECQRNIIVSLDVERYLDAGESVEWTEAGGLLLIVS